MRPAASVATHFRALPFAALLALAATACHNVATTSAPVAPDAHRLQRDIAWLADDRLEGRGIGTTGNDSAADRIDSVGAARVVVMAERVVRDIADRDARLTPLRVASSAPMNSGSSGQGSNVYLGSIPDMSGGDAPGLRLSGVRGGSPADVGGLQAGDVIVEFGGKPVTDLYSYSDALYAHKPCDKVEVVYVRNGERRTTSVTLGARGG